MPLAVITACYVGLFGYFVAINIVRQPYWDMYSYIVRYLQVREDGGWLAYLWDPHVQHRHIWMRLLTALDIEAFSGVAYPFIVTAAACQGLAAWVLWRQVRRRTPLTHSAALGCLVLMLVLTSVSAVDCAIPMNGIYPQALLFVVLAVVWFDESAPALVEGRPSWRSVAALAAAMGAAFANAAALVLWPILVWMAWRARAHRTWLVAVGAVGAVFIGVYVAGLPLDAQSDAAGSAGALGVLDYLLTYLGLPWTRASALAVPGRVIGACLLAGGLWAVIRRGLLRPTGAELERVAVALVLFTLGSATLAAFGRAGNATDDVLVPIRYAVFVTPLHVGLLLLAWPAILRQRGNASRRRFVEIGIAAAAVVLVAVHVATGQAAADTTRVMRASLARFAAGEQTPDMRRVVFIDLEQARRDFDAIRSAGLYLDTLSER